MYNKNLNKMTNEQLRMQMLAGIITEGQYKNMLNEDSYESEVLSILKKMASEKQLDNINDEYLTWFKNSEDFKNMISTEKLNHKSPLSAAKSIISIWR